MSVTADLICSPPTSNPVTPALASFPILTPTSRPTTIAHALSPGHPPDPSMPVAASQRAAVVLSSGADDTQLPIHDQAPKTSNLDRRPSLSVNLLTRRSSTYAPDEPIDGPTSISSMATVAMPSMAMTREPVQSPLAVSISPTSPTGSYSFFPPFSPTFVSTPTISSALSDAVLPSLSAISPSDTQTPPPTTLSLMRPHILARASHSDAVPSRTSAPGISVESTLGGGVATNSSSSTNADLGNTPRQCHTQGQSQTTSGGGHTNGVFRRTSLSFKDAEGRRMSKNKTASGVSATEIVGLTGGSLTGHASDGKSRADTANASRSSRSPTQSPILSPGMEGGANGIGRRPSWHISLPSPILVASQNHAQTEAIRSALDSLPDLDEGDGEADGEGDGKGSRLLFVSAENDENAARRGSGGSSPFTRTPYPMSEEEENDDPIEAYSLAVFSATSDLRLGPGAAASRQTAGEADEPEECAPIRKEIVRSIADPKRCGNISLTNPLIRMDLHALHPADRYSAASDEDDIDDGEDDGDEVGEGARLNRADEGMPNAENRSSLKSLDAQIEEKDGSVSASTSSSSFASFYNAASRHDNALSVSLLTRAESSPREEGPASRVKFIDPFAMDRLKSGSARLLSTRTPSTTSVTPEGMIENDTNENRVPGLPPSSSRSRIASFFNRVRVPSSSQTSIPTVVHEIGARSRSSSGVSGMGIESRITKSRPGARGRDQVSGRGETSGVLIRRSSREEGWESAGMSK